MALFNSGQKLTSAALNAIFPAILSQPWIQQQAQGTGGSVGTTFAAPATACTVTVTSTGTVALVFVSCGLASTSGNTRGTVAVSGATTLAASTNETANLFISTNSTAILTISRAFTVPINPGTNTYTLQYRNASSSTGSAQLQHLLVFAP